MEQNEYHITLEEEKGYWDKYIINKWMKLNINVLILIQIY